MRSRHKNFSALVLRVVLDNLTKGQSVMLSIKNLHVKVDGKEILKGLNLEINSGEVHAIMGPNGSGKSSLANVLAGREGYEITQGEVLYEGKNLFELSPETRACEGLFLGFQYPVGKFQDSCRV